MCYKEVIIIIIRIIRAIYIFLQKFLDMINIREFKVIYIYKRT